MVARRSVPVAVTVAVALCGVIGAAPSAAAAPKLKSFSSGLQVADNTSVTKRLVRVRGVGRVFGICVDGNPAPGVEDPDIVISLVPGRRGVNFARWSPLLSAGRPLRPVVGFVPFGTPHFQSLPDSTTFDMRLEVRGRVATILGAVREDGQETPNAACLFFGTVQIARS